MYLPRLNIADATLQSLTLVPFQMRRFRLRHASFDDAKWLQTALTRESQQFATRFSLREDGGVLNTEWR
jgi:poly-gamma-glutamate synthesis protein (capsule biosynthesis protein)